jgi:murein L,D-transpeptidase YcbB/YkuD
MSRLAVAAAGLFCLVAFASSGSAKAEDPISQVIEGGGAEWSDGFDAASSAADVRTSIPILSPQIVDSVQQAIVRYSDIVSRGGWPTVPATKKLKLGVRDAAVVNLRQRLAISGDLPPAVGVQDVFDSYVDAGVRRFQARHGIFADGVVGDSTFAALNIPAAVRLNQLAMNLTRLRMLTANLPARFVVVNIPGAAVEAVENGTVVSRHTAVVGKVDRPSPIVNSKITEIKFNPFWTVPESIIRRDLIPLMQKDPNYLTEYHIRIYDGKGNELQPTQIDWTTDEATKYMFRQDPGDENSLGTVKINFPSPDGVYMHDTPHKGLFNNEFRFDSSGCVRVQNIRELIPWILRDTPDWGRPQIDEAFRTGERVDARVVNPVQLYWVYVTAWAMPDSVVHFRNDIYGLDGLDQLASDTPASIAATPVGEDQVIGKTTEAVQTQ